MIKLEDFISANSTVASNLHWLMIGARSSITEIPPSESRELAIGLVPMKCGSLQLPGISFLKISPMSALIPSSCIRWIGFHSVTVAPVPTCRRLSVIPLDSANSPTF